MRFWPLYLSLAVYAIVTGALLSQSLARTHGHLVYPLDDTYIHMAMAKTFATHGVWGITAHGFSSSTSSPLWTFLLAVVYLFGGISDAAPLVIDVGCSMLLLVLVWWILSNPRVGCRNATSASVLILIVLVSPLPTLTIGGMEHVLQLLTVVLFAHLASTAIAERCETRDTLVLLAVSALMIAVRYEGLFVLAMAVVLPIAARRALTAGLVLGAGLLPIEGLIFSPGVRAAEGASTEFHGRRCHLVGPDLAVQPLGCQ
jgi:hypothetical protein